MKFPAGSVVAFYGDSLTAGFGATSRSTRWSALLCAAHGWHEVNPSISGLGFVQSRGSRDVPAAIIAARPDLILVTLGANDLWIVAQRPDEVESAIRTDLHRLRDETDAVILVAMPFSPISYRPAQLVTLEGWLRDAAGDIGAGIVESASWMADQVGLTVDPVHFNDAGERRVAELMDGEILART